ncbi:MAG: UbiX family flavin prenyltransferase [Candidatus Abyssubacteria bacterium]|nr:UbiX family flavin prenyltransferase [Candidatus Abyssubacteria bacterium]
MKEVIVAITGASGAQYAIKLIQTLVDSACRVHLTISVAGARVLKHEMGIDMNLQDFSPAALTCRTTTQINYYPNDDISAPLASGTFPIDSMVIIPCSMSTLAAVASGLGTNLILRAADVSLKENRKLVLVPRETPLGTIALENMLRASRAGACVLPAMPAFYHGPKKIDDMVDFIVGKVLDQLGVQHKLFPRWGDNG